MTPKVPKSLLKSKSRMSKTLCIIHPGAKFISICEHIEIENNLCYKLSSYNDGTGIG